MTKKEQKIELEAILETLRSFPHGLGVEGMLRSGKLRLSRRTLQRRLFQLNKLGKVLTEGEGRRLRYLAASTSIREVKSEALIPISPEGMEIRSYVRQPVQRRTPVGYNPDFLAEYRPNMTAYLSQKLREELHEMGRSSYGVERTAGTFARDILDRLLIDLSWASSRLEGNTYSILDTKRLIEFGQVAEGKDAVETQMILNHKAAIELLVDEAEGTGFDRFTVFNLHGILSEGLLPDPQDSGRLRRKAVGIDQSVYTPLSMPQRIEEYFSLVLEKVNAIKDPFEQSFFMMVHIPYLQPFMDVNKRTSRLIANIPFIKGNFSPLSFIDMPKQDYVEAILGVYEMNRIELLRDVFTWAYGRSCQQYVALKQSLVSPDPFRMKYRMQLAEAVRSIVQGGLPATVQSVRAAVPILVAKEDISRFVELTARELNLLHEGNIARFKIRPSEFKSWHKKTTEEGGNDIGSGLSFP